MAALALLSACQTILPEEEETPHVSVSGGAGQDVQYFTAAIGTDTKTTVEYDASRNVYKTVWSENDRITVINAETGEYESCQIIEGAGTNVAKFAGTMNADHYYAVYGENVGLSDDGLPSVYLSSYQSSYYRLHDWLFPMFAQSSSKSFSFQNLCSLIKINVTGTEGDYLNYISLEANSSQSYMNGRAQIYMSGNEPQLDFLSGSPELTVSVYEPLYATERSVYVVLPSQTYRGGFKLTFDLDSGIKTINITDDVVMRRSRIRNLNVNLTSDPVYDVDQDWFVCLSEDDGDSWDNYQMDLEDGMYVYRDLYISSSTSLRLFEYNEDVYYGCSSQFRNSWSKTNTCIELASSEGWWWLGVLDSGYYDVYVDPARNCAYIMSSGCSPYYLPTQEPVVYDSYDMLYSYAPEESIVKVLGVVMAKNANGFVISIDGYDDNYVYVYDPYGYCQVDLGYVLDLYAVAKDYRGQKELVIEDGRHWYHMWRTDYRYYEFEYSTNIDAASYSSHRFDYVNVTGYYTTSVSSGKTYYHLTDEWGNIIASITSPLEDLSSYEGLKVNVEGFYQGRDTNGTAVIVMRRICFASGGSTEEILPGGSITVN